MAKKSAISNEMIIENATAQSQTENSCEAASENEIEKSGGFQEDLTDGVVLTSSTEEKCESDVEDEVDETKSFQEGADTSTSALPESEIPKKESVYEKYILQFQYDSKTELAFIYQEVETELFLGVLFIAKYALRHIRIPSPFEEDTDFVYFTVFNREQYDYIGLMNHALHYCKANTTLTFYGESAEKIAYGLKECGVDYLIAHPDTCAKIYNHSDINDPQFIPCMGRKLSKLLHDISEEIIRYCPSHCIGNAELYRKTLHSIFKSLDIDKNLYEYVRWKSEYEMYSLLKMFYPDTMFQYRSEWLGRQSLDAYVPSIKVGFEYQGRQHYESVDFFGGQETYEHQVKNDALKKKKCKQNGVLLVEWVYTEPIYSSVLRDKLSKINISLSEKPVNLFDPQNTEDATVDIKDIEALNIDRSMDPKELFNKSLEMRNIGAMNESLKILARKNPKALKKYWERLANQYADENLAPINITDEDDPYGADMLRILVRSKILTEYYLCRECVRDNYYTRKIVLYLIKDGCDSDTVALYLEKMRNNSLKRGEKRSEFNSRIKCLYDEAGDYDIDEQKIQEILLKIGIKSKSKSKR